MGSLIQFFFNSPMVRPLLRPILRPLMRIAVGLIAIPIFRFFLKRVIRLQELDAELEKDLEQWFQGSLILLAATANMEEALFAGWAPANLHGDGDAAWVFMGFRILVAISVIDFMPDQELFAIIHPGPPKLKLSRKYGYFREIKEKFRDICRGYLCKHLNQSSPVFAILAAIATGWLGWVFYGIAIAQYLIIGLVTSRDKALDLLSEFDRQVALRRREIIEEFELTGQADTSKTPGMDSPAPDTPHAMPSPATNIQNSSTEPGNVAIRSQDGYES
jgi:hypothetical protein